MWAASRTSTDTPFRLGPWLVEPGRNTISHSETSEETRLHPKAMEVLVALAWRAPEVFPREELIDQVWGGAFVGEEVLTGNIRELRKAFGDDAKKPRVIEPVPKRGYRLLVAVGPTTVAPVATEAKAPEPSRAHWTSGGALGFSTVREPARLRKSTVLRGVVFGRRARTLNRVLD